MENHVAQNCPINLNSRKLI